MSQYIMKLSIISDTADKALEQILNKISENKSYSTRLINFLGVSLGVVERDDVLFYLWGLPTELFSKDINLFSSYITGSEWSVIFISGREEDEIIQTTIRNSESVTLLEQTLDRSEDVNTIFNRIFYNMEIRRKTLKNQ